MIVVSLTNCPPKLRGDLSKWLLEINTGVYVGKVSARVRDALWKRICDNITDGQATMVFPAQNEQHMDFYVHNSAFKPVDFDGIKLMKHLDKVNEDDQSELKAGFSDAAKRRMGRKRRQRNDISSYVLLDIETTGLSYQNDQIIEIGIVCVENNKISLKKNWLIKSDKKIPQSIVEMTGITDCLIDSEGIWLEAALDQLFSILTDKTVLLYNSSFDMSFLEKASEKYNIDVPYINIVDVLVMARTKLKSLDNYRLENVALHLDICTNQEHRAVGDCLLLYEVYCKLNEI